MVGKYADLPSTPNLRHPPPLPGSDTKRYHSVKGYTGGSDVFMIYTNKKAYPEYLITYKD
jgi:hypothetical protein